MKKKLVRGVNGALVTALAATPILATPVGSVSADVSQSDVLEKLSTLSAIYERINDKAEVRDGRDYLLEEAEWSDIYEDITIDDLSNDDKQDILEGLSNILYASDFDELAEATSSFETTYNNSLKPYLVDADEEEIPFIDFVDFLATVQLKTFDYIKENESELDNYYPYSESTDDPLLSEFILDAYDEVLAELKDDGNAVYEAMDGSVVLNSDGILGAYFDVQDESENNEEIVAAQEELVNAVLGEANEEDGNDNDNDNDDNDNDNDDNDDNDNGNDNNDDEEEEEPTDPTEPAPNPTEPGGDDGDDDLVDVDVDPVDGQVIVDDEAVDVTDEETEDGKTVVRARVNAERIQEALEELTPEQAQKITIKLVNNNDANRIPVVSVPSQAVKAIAEKNPNTVLEIGTEDAAYELPVRELNLQQFAQDLGVDSEDDVEIEIQVNLVAEDDAEATTALTNNNLNRTSSVIEFTVRATANGQSRDVTKFSSYVNRTVQGENDFNATFSTAVLLRPDGTFAPIPTLFAGSQATLKSQTNSKYTIVENDDVSFTDTTDLWNKDQVEKLAAKYIVQGKEDGSFDPQSAITRSEFSALVARSLALFADEDADAPFTDIRDEKWYADPISAVYEAGIVQGREDGSFDPGASLTRIEGVLMLDRLFEYVGFDAAQLNEDVSIDDFEDVGSIPAYARDAVERMVQAGVINGRSNGNFDPYGDLDRAAMVKVLDESLEFVNFISEDDEE
ncbi:S-layer homology domain-containing protein [Halobacillus litoralis]|uniref:S-layer homology domain-containing protein n=1 Tax=Halobacillus litoralis TaxID=45668 RepID=UPI001CD3B653|nr:S-layer homology domain-containing protein [Halobacillus litoralis]MCA0971509.1 S-layer homology domain-containing protein [Halobacillus litoralis]